MATVLEQTRPTAARAGLRSLLVQPLPADRLAGWLGPLAVALVAAFLRFNRLSVPHKLVFDEVYYAKDSLSLLHHGVELSATGPSFVVHPPLGKWLIALGEWIFGDNSLGWRFSAALVGTLSVLILARTVRRMTRSTLLGCIAGLLLALDGLAFVQSRISMLDGFLLFWLVAALACLVADRDDGRRRLADRVEAEGRPVGHGPRLGLRWWRVGAGLCLAASVATKWNGIYYVAAYLLLAFAWDVGARRTAGVRAPVRGTLVRDAGPLLLLFLALPAVLYVVSWAGWFLTGTGYDRHWAAGRATSWPFLPEALRSWWHYQWEIWHFHTTLDAHHPYQSHALGWLLLARPVAYFYSSPQAGELGCTAASGGCSKEILGIGTPAVWWPAIPALVAMVWLWVSRRDWRAVTALVGVALGILTWVPSDLHHRTMFLFYALPALPFMVIALTLCLGWALGPRDAAPQRRMWGAVGVGAYLLVVTLNFFYLYPILAAKVIPYTDWHARMWFPSWI